MRRWIFWEYVSTIELDQNSVKVSTLALTSLDSLDRSRSKSRKVLTGKNWQSRRPEHILKILRGQLFCQNLRASKNKFKTDYLADCEAEAKIFCIGRIRPVNGEVGRDQSILHLSLLIEVLDRPLELLSSAN